MEVFFTKTILIDEFIYIYIYILFYQQPATFVDVEAIHSVEEGEIDDVSNCYIVP